MFGVCPEHVDAYNNFVLFCTFFHIIILYFCCRGWYNMCSEFALSSFALLLVLQQYLLSNTFNHTLSLIFDILNYLIFKKRSIIYINHFVFVFVKWKEFRLVDLTTRTGRVEWKSRSNIARIANSLKVWIVQNVFLGSLWR